MSVEAMAWAFKQPIPPAPKIVLLALSNNADKEGKNCYPALRTIVENCAPMQVRTIQNHLRWLEANSLITITPWFHPSGRQTSNLYELRLSTIYCGEGAESCTGGRVQKAAPGRVQKAAPGRVQKAAPLLNPDLLDLKKNEEDPPSPQAGGSSAVVGVASEDEFRRFWEQYPAKVGKKAARRAWQKARDRPPIEAILAAIAQAKRSRKWRDGIIPNPATWINQGRWDDGDEVTVVVGTIPKAYQSATAIATQGDPCPPEVAERLAKLRGKESFSFPAEKEPV